MDQEKYYKFIMKAEENKKATEPFYAKQVELSKIANEKMEAFYEIEDKLYELYKEGTKKAANLGIKSPSKIDEDSMFKNLNNVLEIFINQTNKYKEYSKAVNSIPEIKEAGNLEQEREKRFFEYARAHLKLDQYINECKDKLFTKDYLDRMDDYAEEGIFLYFLETPDPPILDKDISYNDFLDTLKYGDYISLRTLFESFFKISCPGESLVRKQEDMESVFGNLYNGYYRTAARTMFALIENELKNTSQILEGYFEKEKKYKNGKQRAAKIESILPYIDMPHAKENWNIFNAKYERISKSDGMIDRNAIIHGDYKSDKLDVGENDVIKLMLMYLSFKTLGDYIQFHSEIFKEAFNYANIFAAQKLKKS